MTKTTIVPPQPLSSVTRRRDGRLSEFNEYLLSRLDKIHCRHTLPTLTKQFRTSIINYFYKIVNNFLSVYPRPDLGGGGEREM